MGTQKGVAHKRIVIVESFYNGSHKYWADQVKKYSKHKVEIVSLPGRYWKWRMEAGAIELAEKINQLDYKADYFLVSSLIDLPLLKSLVKIEAPFFLYMHENQLAYPLNIEDTDYKEKRDNHYAFKNYTSCLVADKVLFNSHYNYNSFIDALPSFLNQFPNGKDVEFIKRIRDKSSVVPLGINEDTFVNDKGNKVSNRILWNHRWEFDKGIKEFLELMIKIKNEGEEFELVLLGSRPNKLLNIIIDLLKELESNIVRNAYCETRTEYIKWVKTCSIIPVTSKHDFFGVSVLEAINLGVYPLLPNGLAYPEHVEGEEVFFDSYDELKSKLKATLRESKSLDFELKKYKWENVIQRYDELFNY